MNLKNLPQKPGVYLFKNRADIVIYVGKALNIKNRVSSYFRDPSSMYNLLVKEIENVETKSVSSDLEALILEANLIKKFQPKFNVRLKDDKDYLYIKITNDPYPKVVTARKRDLKGSLEYFGPYPSARSVRTTIKLLRKTFPFRTCRPNQGRACLYFHLGLCLGVCIGAVTEKTYLTMIKRLISFLSGKQTKVVDELEKEMKKAAKEKDFEKAALFKKNLESIRFVLQPAKMIAQYLTNQDEDSLRDQELKNLKEILNLSRRPTKIECYDISNIQGTAATGSMVTFINGQPDYALYRRFKIKTVQGINDYAAIQEVLRRRFRRIGGEDISFRDKPDLIIVDGGKGQLNAAKACLSELKRNIPTVALAKRYEEIYSFDKPKPIRLPMDSLGLHLIQRLRDEAHRFAIKYHRLLRLKRFLN